MMEKIPVETNQENQQAISNQQNELPADIKDAKYSTDPAKRKLFDDFIKREREIAESGNVSALEHAERSKENAEVLFSLEKNRFEEQTQKVEQLRNQIDAKKSRLITKILEFKKIRELHKQLNLREKIASSIEADLNSKNELVEAYDYMLSEEKELAVLNEKIANENKDKEERKKLEYIEDEKRRTIEDLAGQHGVFFVHDIVDAEWKPGENNNAIDTTKLNFLDQLDIVNGFDPTISVSTLKKDTKQRTFGNGSWGVLLSGGRVIGGEQNDAGTKAYGLRDRRLFGGEDTKTIKGIESAIHGSDGNRTEGYNELVVEKPEIAGVYMKWDEMRPALQEGEDNFLVNENGVRYDRWWEKMNDNRYRK